MPSIEETAIGNTPLSDSLAAGVANISYAKTVTFWRYVRQVLPLDGYVFYLRAPILLSGDDEYNQHDYNKVPNNQGGMIIRTATELICPGSLHYASQQNQVEENSATTNPVIFTTKIEVSEFNYIDPNTIWVAEIEGEKFAFNESGQRYQQAGLFHYRGSSLIAPQITQLVDSLDQLNLDEVIVSNSLPIWLSLSKYMQVFPSFLVPMNMQPPYATAHINPDETTALQSMPFTDNTGSTWQLAKDTVKFTIYGLRNNDAIDFQNYILSESLNAGAPFGVMNMPLMQDLKELGPSFQIIAQKKTFTLEVSYYQTSAHEIARQMIRKAMLQLTVVDYPPT